MGVSPIGKNYVWKTCFVHRGRAIRCKSALVPRCGLSASIPHAKYNCIKRLKFLFRSLEIVLYAKDLNSKSVLYIFISQRRSDIEKKTKNLCACASLPAGRQVRGKTYPILNTQIPNGGNLISAENSRPFQGSLSIFIGFELLTPLPPYSMESELKIWVSLPFAGNPIR